MTEIKSGCDSCAAVYGSPAECPCGRYLGDDQMITIITQYTRQPDGSIKEESWVGGDFYGEE